MAARHRKGATAEQFSATKRLDLRHEETGPYRGSGCAPLVMQRPLQLDMLGSLSLECDSSQAMGRIYLYKADINPGSRDLVWNSQTRLVEHPDVVGCWYGRKAYPTQDWPEIRDACRSSTKPRSDWSKIWTQQPIMTQYWPIAGCQCCIQNASEFREGPSSRTDRFARSASHLTADCVCPSSATSLNTSKSVFKPRKPVYLATFNVHSLKQADQQRLTVISGENTFKTKESCAAKKVSAVRSHIRIRTVTSYSLRPRVKLALFSQSWTQFAGLDSREQHQYTRQRIAVPTLRRILSIEVIFTLRADEHHINRGNANRTDVLEDESGDKTTNRGVDSSSENTVDLEELKAQALHGNLMKVIQFFGMCFARTNFKLMLQDAQPLRIQRVALKIVEHYMYLDVALVVTVV
ncbi:hypothetical protein CLF_107576 [Clonorchis sinensis]|uniref:Uncharacterized protein n=1 Tax=Clonorchis sinensis TaxID=79923 RepID=G7YQU2_CLOSI|nr:hypothetical protein CLF_107576 [Clonorchis sinensis]